VDVTMPSAESGVEKIGVSRLLEQEARIVGIKGFSTPTLEAVDRRRSQLWTVAFAGLVCLAAAVALLTSKAGHHLGFANGLGFRIGTVVLVVGLAVYVTEKERHLRRLAKLLVDERVLGAALSNRLKELAMLYEAGKAMNSVLVVDEVLQLILSSAFELLGASSGSIMLLQEEGDLVVVCRAGNASGAPIELGGGIASRVARDREPLLVQGTVSEKGRQETESAVCVPLQHRGQVLGVINLIGATGHTYSEYDLRAVSLFAEHAAIAVANARLYEAERALSAQLSHQVVHDPLTGAANRVLISDRLGHALARVRRQESQVAVLFIDVDNFKLVNDELGHETGDFVLTAIAQRLAECVRPTDTVGRFGGDEFLVICEDLTHDGQGVEIAERILEGLSRPFETPFGERIVSASIGVAPCGSGRPESVANLIRAADQAMYRAKMEGKARIVSALTRAPGPA
jgi:diguanylate cyclase (GGDEF)-like protein